MNEADFDREFMIKEIIISLSDMDLSGKAWDDYDEHGVPYWEKWHTMECECGKLTCPKCSDVGR